jgi:hypothetical protein
MSPLQLLALFVMTVILVALAFEAGLRLGRWRSRRPDPEPQLPVRTLVASSLGLLSFMLGFTFALATSHFDSRRQSVFDEAVAIGTAYHRADFLPDAERVEIQSLLRDYIDLRLEIGRTDNRDHVLERASELREKIWRKTTAAAKANAGAPSITPMIQSVTDVIDAHAERVVEHFQDRISLRVWLLLYLMMAVAVAVAGYSSGLAGARRSIAALAYGLLFSVVVVLIASGDVPGPRQFWDSHQALIDLRARLVAP